MSRLTLKAFEPFVGRCQFGSLEGFSRLARVLLGSVLLLPAWAASSARAVTIQFEAIDLSDPVAGQDLWQYRYSVSDFAFGADFGFSILFDEDLYAQLEDPPPPVNADWDVITLQPDTNLPDPGRYDAVSLVAVPSLADLFVVDFVWLGEDSPGSQPFEIFDPDFETIETGDTVPIPEPNTVSLIVLGLASLGTWAGAGRIHRKTLRYAEKTAPARSG